MSSVDSNPNPPEPSAQDLRAALDGVRTHEADEERCALFLARIAGDLSMSCSGENGQPPPDEPWSKGRAEEFLTLRSTACKLAQRAREAEALLQSASQPETDESEPEFARRAGRLRERVLELPLELFELAAALQRLGVSSPPCASADELLPVARRATEHWEARSELALPERREEQRSVLTAVLRELEELDARRPRP